MAILAGAYRDALDDEARAVFDATPKLAGVLEASVRAARAQWPGVSLNEAEFGFHLASVGVDVHRLDTVRIDELVLAFAAAQGDVEAVLRLEVEFMKPALAALSTLRWKGDQERYTSQMVRQKLLVEDENNAPKLLQYSGRGPLGGWLRVTALRTAMSVLRVRGIAVTESDDALADLAVADLSPDVAHLRARYGAEFKRAFEEAFAQLDPEDRTVLRLSLIDGLSIDQLGPVLGCHRATAARRIQRTKEALVEGTRAVLMQRLQISADEFESLMLVMMSQLDWSIERVLRDQKR